MTSAISKTELDQWQQLAEQCLIQGNYSQAASLYEQAIEAEPEVKSHYWYLGLTLLLQEQEEEAHTTWLLGMVDGKQEQVEQWTAELQQVLQAEAERREYLAENSVAWLIRQHMKEIQPTDIDNLLHLIQLSIQEESFTGNDLTDWGVIEILKIEPTVELDRDLLLQGLRRVLDADPWHPAALELVEASLAHIRDPQDLLEILLPSAVEISHWRNRPDIAARIAEICLRVDADNLQVLGHLTAFYQNAGQYQEGIETAKLCYSLAQELADKVAANQLILRALLTAGGCWEEARAVFVRQESLLLSLIEAQPRLSQNRVSRLFSSYFFASHMQDEARANRRIQNQVAQICQANVEIYAHKQVEQYRQRHLQRRICKPAKPLKIGYLSGFLKEHSVGWLARWVFQYLDRERFQINGYFVNFKPLHTPLHEWYVSQVNKAFYSVDGLEIAERIYQDEIDILIDLDSITVDTSCEVMALKPAPVQVAWLGWDATGTPAVDYFIADPYVLPESAPDYYAETIWRLPQTYIAVDGFEVAVPKIRRDELDIASDAVVYFSGQKSYKRHTDTARLQIKILKEVPNSYFAIKGIADEEAIKSFFTQLAEEEGVDGARLRFLPLVGSEVIHRANLGIADVVLDTYPYNGATTTLETLWMGIPLVTRVGEQFSARNSYAMMMNAGVTEGIAWSDEEYVEWGIRLGKDSALRQQISWKLRMSRHTSPLWNGKQFTREMENAYEQMWHRYLDGK